MFVSCWHMNDSESTAMWREYVKDTNGLAIQSTFSRLAQCLNGYSNQDQLKIGMVNYIDYEVDKFNLEILWEFIFSKRKPFEHERELRAVIWKRDHETLPSDSLILDPFTLTEPQSDESGVVIPVVLADLIDRIIVAPKAAPWFKNLVESICSKYNLNCPIKQSALSEMPLK